MPQLSTAPLVLPPRRSDVLCFHEASNVGRLVGCDIEVELPGQRRNCAESARRVKANTQDADAPAGRSLELHGPTPLRSHRKAEGHIERSVAQRGKRYAVRLQHNTVVVPDGHSDNRPLGSGICHCHSGDEAGCVVEGQNIRAGIAGLNRHDGFMLAAGDSLAENGEAADAATTQELGPTCLHRLVVRSGALDDQRSPRTQRTIDGCHRGLGNRGRLRKGERQRQRIAIVIEEVQTRLRAHRARIHEGKDGLPETRGGQVSHGACVSQTAVPADRQRYGDGLLGGAERREDDLAGISPGQKPRPFAETVSVPGVVPFVGLTESHEPP